MNWILVPAGLAAAIFVGSIVGLFVRPKRGITNRISPYAQLSRTKLGKGADVAAVGLLESDVPNGIVQRVLYPIFQSFADSFSRLVDVGSDDKLRLRLRQAGFMDTSPEQYRVRQLGYAVGFCVACIALGIMLGSTALTLVAGVFGFWFGGYMWRSKVNRAIKERTGRMRVEVYTVAHLVAMYIRAGSGSMSAVSEVVQRGHGPIVGELGEAVAWIHGGLGQWQAFERLAEETPEPAAGRLYRTIGEGVRSGGDLVDTLLAMSADLRTERKEELERNSTKRRGAMLIPTVMMMAPVVLLFLLAPIPTLFFGNQ